MAKIARKLVQDFINCTPSENTASYEVLGADLEELSVEFSADIEKKKNILGEESINLKGYEKEASVEPYIADTDSNLFKFLQDIIDNEKVLDDVKTDVVRVKLYETATSGAYPATKEEVYIEVVSAGGDTTGYQIPFNIHYTGIKTEGTFNPTTKAFTAKV